MHTDNHVEGEAVQGQVQSEPPNLSFDPAVCAFEILKRSYEERSKQTRGGRGGASDQNTDER